MAKLLSKIQNLEIVGRGKRRNLKGYWALLFYLVAAFMSIWYLYTSARGVVSTETNRGFYILFTLVLVFLIYPFNSKSNRERPTIVDVIFILLISLSIGYWINQYFDYCMFRVTAPSQMDLIMGTIAILMVLEGVRRTLGPLIPILAILFLAQLYFGRYLPGKLSHSGMSITRILEFTYNTQEALFGVVTATFATYVFPFMIFGAFLERSGAGDFFMDLAKAVTGQWRGGPAKIATVTSALFGSISGSSVANVATTGTFTIPMMKRTGFTPKMAGAVEAIASTGGQIMPPIMGASVFILATLTETRYLDIAIMNIIAALLYFIFLLIMIDLAANRLGLEGLSKEELPDTLKVLKRGWFFFVPIALIVVILFNGYTPDLAAFWATFAAFVLSWLRKDTRMYPKDVFHSLVNGAKANMAAGSAIGALGIIVGGTVLAGLGLKFSAVLVEFAGGNLLLTTFLVLVISIIIGMGSTTTGSYIILATVAAPALTLLGVPKVNAHLVVFYGAALSNITPPVCVSAFTAAAIAQADPMQTGKTALKYGIVLILLPFGFVYYPALLLQGTVFEIIYTTVSIFFGLVALAMAIQGGDFLNPVISWKRRIIFFAAAAITLIPSAPWLNYLGILLIVLAWLPSIKIYRDSDKEKEGEVLEDNG